MNGRVTDPEQGTRWWRWHLDYDDPASALSRRLDVVQRRIRDAVEDAPMGTIRLISVCAGQGRDVLGALDQHSRAADVVGRLVELDDANARAAVSALSTSGLTGIEVVRADASVTDAYGGAVPANVLLLCGVFGNVSDADIERTVRNASRLCASGAVVIWTRHRRPPDLTDAIRDWFEQSQFVEVAFDSPQDQSFAVGTHRLVGDPLPFAHGLRLFEFA